jgi:hypothetical protein
MKDLCLPGFIQGMVKIQSDGKLKNYTVRDLLLRPEEKGFIELPSRIKLTNGLKTNPLTKY